MYSMHSCNTANITETNADEESKCQVNLHQLRLIFVIFYRHCTKNYGSEKQKEKGELYSKSIPAALIVMRILRKENNGLMNMSWFTRQYYYLQKS